ncbi:MAG: DNA processing protein DprA [Candidatus Poribacteria bacterium]|nr:MAG: DNA processing protein DprA [Candidatus Poribacteria bacterium]
MKGTLSQERIARVALATVYGVNRRRWEALLAAFRTAEEVFAAPITALAAVSDVRISLAERILAQRSRWEEIQERAERLAARGVLFHFPDEETYPERLRAVSDAPPLLLTLGDFSVWNGPCVAVVGCREPSEWGRRGADWVAREAAELGWCVVSGLARGVDQIAHREALEAFHPDGSTLAVLPTPPDNVYPPGSRSLARRIVQRGCLVSEQFAGPVRPERLVQRNRIISGLSLGVIVVEAERGEGSLHTARYAVHQRRPVAVWGEFPQDGWPEGNRLLAHHGATVITRENWREWLALLQEEGADYRPPGLLFHLEEVLPTLSG